MTDVLIRFNNLSVTGLVALKRNQRMLSRTESVKQSTVGALQARRASRREGGAPAAGSAALAAAGGSSALGCCPLLTLRLALGSKASSPLLPGCSTSNTCSAASPRPPCGAPSSWTA